MKLKRICAFLIMVFVLSGCASDIAMNVSGASEQAQNNALTTQLTHRNNIRTTLHADMKQEVALKEEIRAYALSKKLNTKLVKQDGVQSSLKLLAQKSQAAQYEEDTPIQNEQEEPTQEDSTPVLDEYQIRATLYGVDCYGCNVREDGSGNTATGVQLHPTWGVQQSNGEWLEGLTYDGYYIIAMDPSIPFYSIVEISNHGLSGMGFSPDQPIKCMVLDRGGAIYGNHIDLYVGSENYIDTQVFWDGSVPTLKILRYGSGG